MKHALMRWAAGGLAMHLRQTKRFGVVILAATFVGSASAGKDAREWEIFPRVSFAVRHPKEFSVVVSVMGLLDFPRRADLPAGQNYTVPVARFGGDPSQWHAFNPTHQADALRDHAVLIITAADAFDRTMNEHFHAQLRELKVAHEYLVLPGAHTFEVVHAAMPRVVEFVGRSLAQPTSAPYR